MRSTRGGEADLGEGGRVSIEATREAASLVLSGKPKGGDKDWSSEDDTDDGGGARDGRADRNDEDEG